MGAVGHVARVEQHAIEARWNLQQQLGDLEAELKEQDARLTGLRDERAAA